MAKAVTRLHLGRMWCSWGWCDCAHDQCCLLGWQVYSRLRYLAWAWILLPHEPGLPPSRGVQTLSGSWK